MRSFIDATVLETGFKIEFASESLKEDTWLLDILTNTDYKEKIQKLLSENEEIDLFDAIMHEFQLNGPGENY